VNFSGYFGVFRKPPVHTSLTKYSFWGRRYRVLKMEPGAIRQIKKLLYCVIMLTLLLSCGNEAKTVIIISANSEWNAFGKIITPEDGEMRRSPYGDWFRWKINGRDVVFFHGGWGKIDASASSQYVIDKFRPELIVNLGTAGGFPGKIRKGDILLASKTITYDIIEKMGDSQEAIDYYTTETACPVIGKRDDILVSPIVSADQDLFPERIGSLSKKYGAFAGDWESSAIAHVCKKNGVRCYIVRGISDIVYPSGSETYGDFSAFERSTEEVMKKLVKTLDQII
jgi:adenosylhomocysteine nucleosidase